MVSMLRCKVMTRSLLRGAGRGPGAATGARNER